MLLLYTETSSCVSNRDSDNTEVRREVYPNLQQKYVHSYVKINDIWVLDGIQRGFYEDGNEAYVYNYIKGVAHGCQKEYSHKLSFPSHKLIETYYFYGLSCTSTEFKWKTNQLDPNYVEIVGPTGAMGWMGPGLSDYYCPSDSPARFIFPLIENNQIELAKRLIKRTSDLNCNKNGQNLISFTLQHTKNCELIDLLLSKGVELNPSIVLDKDLLFYLIDNCPSGLVSSFKNNWYYIFRYDQECIEKLYNSSIIYFDEKTIDSISNLNYYNIAKSLGFNYVLSDRSMEYLSDRPDDMIQQVLMDSSSSDVSRYIDFVKNYKTDGGYDSYDSYDDGGNDEEVYNNLLQQLYSWFPEHNI